MSSLSAHLLRKHEPVWRRMNEQGEDLFVCRCQLELPEPPPEGTLVQFYSHIVEVTEVATRTRIWEEIVELEHDAPALRRRLDAGTSITWVQGWDEGIFAAARLARKGLDDGS